MKIDTRNNWLTKMFKCKLVYNCLRKQSVMDTCTSALKYFEKHGFKFTEIGYGGNHLHFTVDVPKKYSILNTIIMFNSHTSKRIFEEHPNFRKRYPRGEFRSRYEHHDSTGLKELKDSEEYIKKQQEHHQVKVIDDKQKKLDVFVAEQDTATS